MNMGRMLYANNSSPIRGLINEMAELSSSSFIPQFFGEDEAWGNQAEEWMARHDLHCDRAGPPFNMRIYRRNVIIGVIRDGDVGTILTEAPGGYPLLQVVPAHRIGSRQDQVIVEDDDSPFKGCRITDGVIIDDYFKPLAYRIFGENPWDVTEFVDVSAANMFLSFIPEWCGQVRGFSAIASAAFSAQDIMESRQFSLLAQKANSAIAYIEENEKGEAPPGAGFVIPPSQVAMSSQSATNGVNPSATGLNYEVLDGGTIRYFKARTGSKITSPGNDRPAENAQNYEDRIIRGIFHGVNWSTDFSLDPTKAGGAQMRIIIDKVNRTIQTYQDLLLLPAMQRINGYRVSKAIKIGLIPKSDDWWKFHYIGPEELTADKKYASDVSCQELEAGLTSHEREINKRKGNFERITMQKIRERKFLEDQCKKAGVDPDKIWRYKTNSPISTDQDSEEPKKANTSIDK